ncbi:MAG: hypothetical protein J1F01_03830 [Oscillospiraceae bacterium]|nr:hypothetical protein [Oscillospiraceae bacterium]
MKKKILCMAVVLSLITTIIPSFSISAYAEEEVKKHRLQYQDEEGNPLKTPVEISFGSMEYGYEEVEGKTIYLVNIGNTTAQISNVGTHAGFEIVLGELNEERTLEPTDKLPVTVKPQIGLNAGEYKMTTYLHDEGDPSTRALYSAAYKFLVTPVEVNVKPDNAITKYYGETKLPADVQLEITDKNGEVLSGEKLEGILGSVSVTSAGFDAYAPVSETPYPYTIKTDYSGSNYSVEFADGYDEGIGVTVEKATPGCSMVHATGVVNGSPLSKSVLSGEFVNPYTRAVIPGTLEWIGDTNETLTKNTEDGVTSFLEKQYRFTPDDQNNYNIFEGEVQIAVTNKELSDLSVASGTALNTEYDGVAKTVDFVTQSSRTDSEIVKYRPQGSTDEKAWTTTAPIDAGVYEVHAELPETETHARGFADAILTITPRQAVIGFQNPPAYQKTYDGTTAVNLYTPYIRVKNVVKRADTGAFDMVTIKESAISAWYDDKNAENNKNVNITVAGGTGVLLGKDAKNYALSADAELHTKANIAKRPVDLILNSGITKEYGQTLTLDNSSFDVAKASLPYTGLVAGDTIADIHAVLSSGAVASDASTGTYTVTAIAESYSNYSVTNSVIGSIIVTQARPDALSVSAGAGHAGNSLDSVTITGTFRNPNNNAAVDGKLEWTNPKTELKSGTYEYDWTFTPTDKANYTVSSGKAAVTASDKTPADIDIIFPENLEYNGEAKIANAMTTIASAKTSVKYRLVGVSLQGGKTEGEWIETAPKDAGTYEVLATVGKTDEFAENSIIKTMVITPATPTGKVTAGKVDEGARLSASTLTPEFTGVNGENVTGQAIWRWLGSDTPDMIVVTPDTEYSWTFVPDSMNYKSVSGTSIVEFNPNVRKAQAVIYNLPSDDYAYVTVDGENVKEGDIITFYRDADMIDPVSNSVQIGAGVSGQLKIALDYDALNAAGGKLYVKIAASAEINEVTYKPELGFSTYPIEVFVKENETSDIQIIPSDESYTYSDEDVSWRINDPDIAYAAKGIVTGMADGRTVLNVSISFNHPDTSVNEKITVTRAVNVTVTDEEPPQYEYTTLPATDIEETSAKLHGRVDITLAEGSSIKPYALLQFRLWEKGHEEEFKIKDVMATSESRDYSWEATGLKPDTEYEYQAIGANGELSGNIEAFRTLAIPDTREATAVIYNLPENDYARVQIDGVNVSADDIITFYSDEAMTDPVSNSVTIDADAEGMFKIELDDGALSKNGGTLYVNIDGSSMVTKVPYRTELDFATNTVDVYVKPGETAEVTVILSDEIYTIDSIDWVTEDSEIAAVENGTITGGEEDGTTVLYVTVRFVHPDDNETDRIEIVKTVNVTVTELNAPVYTYITLDAEDITETSAMLSGEVYIDADPSLTPNALTGFKLWQKGNDAVPFFIGGNILHVSSWYSYGVYGLQPGTTYQYQAVGAEGEEGDIKEFTTLYKRPYTIDSIEPGDNGVMVNITAANNAQPAMLITAAYDDEGRLLAAVFDYVNPASKEISVDIDLNGARNIKAFIWNDIASMHPMCGTEEIQL